MNAIKSETKQISISFLTVLEEKSIDLSQPKEVKNFLATLSVNEIASFFPLVASRLFAEGVYRKLSADMAKAAKVGSLEYRKEVERWLAVWERGYLTPAEESRATKQASKGGGKASTNRLPFPQAEILTRCRELAPSGKSEKAKRVRETLEKLAGFSVEAFTAYYAKSLENPNSLLAQAVKELSEEQARRIREEQEKLLNGVDII